MLHHLLIEFAACANFEVIGNNSFWKINNFHFVPQKIINDQIWLDLK